MAYEKTIWKNREVEKPRTYTKVENGDGTITLTPSEGNIIEAGTPIVADTMNNIENGIEAAHQAIEDLADELSTHTADYVRQPGYAVTAGTGNAYTVTTDPAPTAYVDGMGIVIRANRANTGAATLNWNGLGAKSIVDSKGNALTSGKIPNGARVSLRYSTAAGNFQLQGEGGEYGTAGAPQVLPGYTVGTDSGLVAGTYSNIKSIQRGTGSISVENTNSVDISISAVDISIAMLKVWYESGAASVYFAALMGEFINSTTLRFTRGVTASVIHKFSYEVIELNNIKSIQRGKIAMSATTVTVNITTVNASKAIVNITGCYSSDSDSYATAPKTQVTALLSSTNITFTVKQLAPSPYLQVGYEVIEFK